MIINKNLAHAVQQTREKDIFFGILSILNLSLVSYLFVTGKNNFDQLIYLAELIFANFEMIVVFFRNYYNLKKEEYVMNMAYLISESTQPINALRDANLEEMIEHQTNNDVAMCRVWYTKVKMAFHTYCCESVDFIFLLLVIGVILQMFYFTQFLSKYDLYCVILLIFIVLQEVLLLGISLVIEMPRRIRQYVQIKLLKRRVRQIQDIAIQITDQIQQNIQAEFQNVANERLLINGQHSVDICQIPAQNQQQVELMQCAICTDVLDPNGELQGLQCHPTHIFHGQCIQDWFKQQVQQNRQKTCPICRKIQ